MGYATECAGIASLHRLLLSGMCGVLAPNNHLQQLNPHLNFDNKAALLTVTRQLSVDSCLFFGIFWDRGWLHMFDVTVDVRNHWRQLWPVATWESSPMDLEEHRSMSSPMASLIPAGAFIMATYGNHGKLYWSAMVGEE